MILVHQESRHYYNYSSDVLHAKSHKWANFVLVIMMFLLFFVFLEEERRIAFKSLQKLSHLRWIDSLLRRFRPSFIASTWYWSLEFPVVVPQVIPDRWLKHQLIWAEPEAMGLIVFTLFSLPTSLYKCPFLCKHDMGSTGKYLCSESSRLLNKYIVIIGTWVCINTFFSKMLS